MRKISTLFYIVILVSASCNLFDKDEQEPGFIYIPSLDFQAGISQGTSSHNITEVWVYANDQMLGAYDLPAFVPALENGPTDIRIFAGIKNNGISSTRIKYPFYSSVDTTIVIQPNEYDTISPVFHYVDDLDIQEFDFEAGVPFEPYGSSDAELISETDPEQVFEGDGSAIGLLGDDQYQFLVRSLDQWQWQEGNTVFLEMDYSCNNTFSVGLIVHSGVSITRHFALVVNPTHSALDVPNWRKIYVDLGFVVLNNPDADFYELYFEMFKDSDNPTAELYLDNLKLVSYED